jgi:hypothetical protein
MAVLGGGVEGGKHFQFAAHNQSFMIFLESEDEDEINFSRKGGKLSSAGSV